MQFATFPTLLLAAAIDSPALYGAFVTGEMDYMTALVRFLVAVVVSAIMLAMLRSMANGYLRTPKPAPVEAEGDAAGPARRSTDEAAPAA
jgi:hypothetical protein